MNYAEKGNKAYLISIVMVAVIGGLLFGYDTAVISGADKGLQAFFIFEYFLKLSIAYFCRALHYIECFLYRFFRAIYIVNILIHCC